MGLSAPEELASNPGRKPVSNPGREPASDPDGRAPARASAPRTARSLATRARVAIGAAPGAHEAQRRPWSVPLAPPPTQPGDGRGYRHSLPAPSPQAHSCFCHIRSPRGLPSPRSPRCLLAWLRAASGSLLAELQHAVKGCDQGPGSNCLAAVAVVAAAAAAAQRQSGSDSSMLLPFLWLLSLSCRQRDSGRIPIISMCAPSEPSWQLNCGSRRAGWEVGTAAAHLHTDYS